MPRESPGDHGDVAVELRLGSHAPYTTGVARRLPRPSFMPFVAILGAGPLGGALAYALASRGRFDEIRLIDPEKTLAAGKALDILQSGPVDGYSTRVTGSASLDAANGAWVRCLPTRSPLTPCRISAKLHRRSPAAMVVCADDAHALPMTRAVATGGVPPDWLVGSAPRQRPAPLGPCLRSTPMSVRRGFRSASSRHQSRPMPARLEAHRDCGRDCRHVPASRPPGSPRGTAGCAMATGATHAGCRRRAGRGSGVVRGTALVRLLVG